MLVVRVPNSFEPERAHAARLVFETLLGLESRTQFEARNDISINVQGEDRTHVRMPDVLFATSPQNWPAGIHLPPERPPRFEAPIRRLSATQLPVLFGRPAANGHWWERTHDGGYFGIDVFGTAFWMLTQLEERVVSERDAHERFPGRSSHAVRAGYIDRPLVDETVRLLAWILQEVWPGLKARNSCYAALPTHDVDRPFKHLFQSPMALLRTMAGDLLRRRDVGSIFAAPSRWVRVRKGPDEQDPFFTFEWLMDQSERAGVRSAFYFICGHSGGAVDGDYDIHHPRMRALLRRIHARGHEIGLHGSYNTFRSADTLAVELGTLKSVCEEENIFQEHWGGRQHVLRYDSAVTPAVWQNAGLSYDATLGFADATGFRCGTCHPFPLYDHNMRRSLPVIERPLIVMDVTLFGANYEARKPADAARRISKLREACRDAGGEFVLLWHNCQLLAPMWRRVYAEANGC